MATIVQLSSLPSGIPWMTKKASTERERSEAGKQRRKEGGKGGEGKWEKGKKLVGKKLE